MTQRQPYIFGNPCRPLLRPYVVKLAQHFEKIGSTDFVRMSKKILFPVSQFLAKANDFGTRTLPILSDLGELAQAQKSWQVHWVWYSTSCRYLTDS